MALIEARDHTELFVKDWGTGRPVILIHGYPLNADSFDRTAMKLVDAGHRVISYDRRAEGKPKPDPCASIWKRSMQVIRLIQVKRAIFRRPIPLQHGM